jgi:hypothetical protein
MHRDVLARWTPTCARCSAPLTIETLRRPIPAAEEDGNEAARSCRRSGASSVRCRLDEAGPRCSPASSRFRGFCRTACDTLNNEVGVVDNNGEETDGVHGAGPGAEALYGHDQGGRPVPRVRMLGRSRAAVLKPYGPAPRGAVGSGLRAAAPRALQALPLRGLHVATSPRERAVPLARAAAPAVPNCRRHASLAALAHSPRLRRRLCGRES